MKLHILILTMLLSCFFGDRSSPVENVRDVAEYAVIESTGGRTEDGNYDKRPVGILPSRTAGYSGENNSISPSFRSTNSGRRVHSSGKAPFRVIKDGKVIDRHCFFIFQTGLKQFSSGIHSSNRYIYSICQLLI